MHLLNQLVQLRSVDRDVARRGFILNILCLGSIFLSFCAFVVSLLSKRYQQESYDGSDPLLLFAIVILFSIVYLISKGGLPQVASYLFVSIYFFASIAILITWSFYLPQGLLTVALVITMAGILVNSKFSIRITIIYVLAIVTLAHLQQSKLMSFDLSWTIIQTPDIGDGIVFGVTFAVIAVVSWLFNKETETALNRARVSERELKKERDLLEIRVEERTRELREAQLERISHVYRFAELGKLASGMFHDLVNPLTLVSLNLSSAQKDSHLGNGDLVELRSKLDRAMLGIKRLESFIDVARKQVQPQEVRILFSVAEEIRESSQMLAHKFIEQQIQFELDGLDGMMLGGNPIKFSKLFTNLIANAIDSYEGTVRKSRRIRVSASESGEIITFSVRDWGVGISKVHMKKVFEPLFTTKPYGKGTGIGLSICKEIVEKDFCGTISIQSTVGKGTEVQIVMPRRTSRQLPQTYEAVNYRRDI